MNHALLSKETDSAEALRKKTGGLRVNQPGDIFEREADHVAAVVASGGHIGGKAATWSLATGTVQRQPAPPGQAAGQQSGQQPAPAPNNYGDALPKLAEALYKTKAVQDLIKHFTEEDPLAKGAADFVKTPTGIAVTGAAATGAIAALAATHRPLPAQLPAIPLGSLSSRLAGFELKLTYQGPVDRPTAAMLTLSYEGKSSDKKKKQSDSEKYRAETARMAAEQEQFRAGLKPQGPKAELTEKQKDDQFVQNWVLYRQGLLGGLHPLVTPAQGARSTSDAGSVTKKEPASRPADPAVKEKKKEEIPVQRKALSDAVADLDSADVESVLRSSGRPLDAETRRYMESRIGFDFSKVRVHTDARAASSARALGSLAYTVGNDVVFGEGRYAPNTSQGRRLLAHELTHVVQQSKPAPHPHPVVHPAPRRIQRLWGINFGDAKQWLLGKLKEVPGYSLFCVVIGKDLISDKPVERNATNLIQGVLDLFPGGKELFEKLKRGANAIDKAYQWVLAQLKDLNLTEEYFSKLLDDIVASVQLAHPFESFNRVKEKLKEPFDKLVEFASRLGKAVLDFILQAVLENFPLGKKVYELLKKAGAVISRIAADPVSFAKNLFSAIATGFKNFGEHIVEHLGEGLKRWIFEEINLPGLKIPEKFDFRGILQMILQALKLTYEQRRPQLVEKLGEQVVYFFETAADVFMRVKKEGFVAIWEMIKEKASNIFDSIIEQARNWAISKIVKLALAKVAALATPIGDAIEIIAGIYETIKFFIEKAEKFVELIDSIVNSLSDMVEGKIDAAAKRVEDTLAKSIPLILRFLAGLLHLEGIGEAIRKIIDGIRKPIDDAIDKVLDFIVAKAMPIWEKGKEAFLSKLAAVKEWWKKKKKFHYGEESHEVSVEGSGDHPEVLVSSSNKTPLEKFLTDVKASKKQRTDILKVAQQLGWREGNLQKPADDEKGSKLYDKLTNLLDNLKAREAPPSKVEYKETHALGGGLGADAYLTSSRGVGSEPEGDSRDVTKNPPIWNDLDPLISKKHYVRGHLLSMRLGGLGKWNNMMPITNTVNQRMNGRVENHLKKATVPGNNRYYHYNVKAEYAADAAVLPPLPDKPKVKDTNDRAAAAEKRLVRLSWTTKPAEFDTDSKTWKETDGELLDSDGKKMPETVKEGEFAPPTVV